MTLQKKSFAGAWEGKFNTLEYDAVMEQRKDVALTVDWEDGRSDVLSGAEIYQLIFDSQMPWMLSANGTIFTTEFEGVIPGILPKHHDIGIDRSGFLGASLGQSESGHDLIEEQ